MLIEATTRINTNPNTIIPIIRPTDTLEEPEEKHNKSMCILLESVNTVGLLSSLSNCST